VNGKAIRIEGGCYRMMPRRGFGRGRMGFGAGVGGICRCPNCGYEQPHMRGQPCSQTRCPKCGSIMVRI